MWARHLGVPPLWPSRVKVICLGLLASCFILSVYQYLAGASAEYLRLTQPVELDISCRLPAPECQRDPRPAECVVAVDKQKWLSDVGLSDNCPAPTGRGQTCLNLSLPLNTLTGTLGSLHSTDGGINPFKFWSILFAVLMSLIALSIVTHDLALLDDTTQRKIFTLAEVCNQTPHLRRYILCLRCRKRSGSRWSPLYRPICLLPCWVVFQALAFMAIVYPFSLAFFVIRPIKMSRMMVFLSSILCSLWSLVFVLLTASRYKNSTYTLMWSFVTGEGEPNCVCLCNYPLRRDVSFRMMCMGLGMLAHSGSLAFRALKGLRRSQWANLFSVMYTVPISAFPVIWTRPKEVGGGGPANHREEGEPVQGEPAFDPFCLMDEQPESAETRVCVAPVLARPEELLEGFVREDVGGCGFPRFLHENRASGAARAPLMRS